MAVGVARPSAQGQAITNTATKTVSAKAVSYTHLGNLRGFNIFAFGQLRNQAVYIPHMRYHWVTGVQTCALPIYFFIHISFLCVIYFALSML